jgi:hypothetical protein
MLLSFFSNIICYLLLVITYFSINELFTASKILELLTRSKVKVRQGRGSTWVEAPVDFSDLSSEYIGILYEGLLDFELRQADRDPTEKGGDGFTLSRKKSESENLHDLWRERRQKYLSYAEKIHPFRYQGSADINTYKLFLEFGLGILRSGGKLGLIVPSGVYTPTVRPFSTGSVSQYIHTLPVAS